MARKTNKQVRGEKLVTVILKRIRDGRILKKRIPERLAIGGFDVLRRITLSGVEYERMVSLEIAEEKNFRQGKRKTGKSIATWPMKSDACGVHPDQIPEAKQFLASQGVPVEYTRDGRAILTGPAHRKAVCRAMGLRDRNGGYSDP